MRADFFDACIPHVWTRLTQEHARFVTQTVDKDDAFARELAEKLDRLAMERAEDEEDIGFHRRDAESPETTTMTPERMCAWMERFADGHDLTGREMLGPLNSLNLMLFISSSVLPSRPFLLWLHHRLHVSPTKVLEQFSAPKGQFDL